MNGPTRDGETLLFRAIDLAARAHHGQYRKGTRLPYLIHPLAVARIMIEAGADDEVVAAGVLHDTVEDGGVSLAEISRDFGPRVARLVEGASEPDKSAPWERRKQDTIDGLASAPADELLVEAADKLDNVRAIRAGRDKLGDAVFERFNRGRDQQAWYYAALARGFEARAGEDPALAAIVADFIREVRAVFGTVSGTP